MESICRRRWYLQLSCLLMMSFVCSTLELPASLGEIDHQCWEISSHKLVEMKKLRVASTVTDLWEFMIFLKESSKPKHNDVFNDLAQNFWDMYIDCVVSRSHGVGRRQLESPDNNFMNAQKTSKAEPFKGVLRQKYRRNLDKMMPD
ncbi:hypothetical protein JRQ81_018588 [Phrynocephalus forsythii]|uniref:Family with sequence similarity 237 member B n=1 Tax=Phrynocephalus forsythii TaxID=171643 RepID=A0A9Q0XPB9_9SAUR|nr:hypothetical protein JRQ81_018588 [Phrynocephalus forsythii]